MEIFVSSTDVLFPVLNSFWNITGISVTGPPDDKRNQLKKIDSPSLPIFPSSPPFPPGNRKSVFYICDSISVL